jgi:hypothetical protein
MQSQNLGSGIVQIEKMGKKKGRRQVDPSRDECESTEDEAEDGENLNSCPHTGKLYL